jgi:hypothetical protein
MKIMHITTGLIGIITAFSIIVLIRKDHLHVRYGVVWIAVAAIFAVLGLFPVIIDKIAVYLGVAYPPTLALTLGFAVLVLKILISDIERSRNLVKIQRLVQRTALLEAEIRSMQIDNNAETQSGEADE